jgi:pimeloyl-ACP methyl ester carboxylesterase
LLFHAAWGDAEMSWSSVWNQLSRSFTVIAADLPGFGQSSGLLRPSLSAMARLLRQLLDALKVDHVITVGNSFGAAVALQFASAYPETASQLVLVNGGYMPVVPGLVRKLIGLPLLKRVFGLLMHHYSFSDRTIEGAFADVSNLPPGFLEKIRQHSHAYSTIVYDVWLDMTEPLAKPAVPTLVLWGTQDKLGPLKYARLLQEWIPDAKLVPIEGAGHMPQVERSEEFVSAIMSLRHEVRT